jgi:hypothetical protein
MSRSSDSRTLPSQRADEDVFMLLMVWSYDIEPAVHELMGRLETFLIDEKLHTVFPRPLVNSA